MVWFKVDDGLPTSRKILSIPRSVRLSAVGLWTLAGAWSAGEELDGHVPDYMVTELGGTPRLVDALVQSGLWEPVGEGAQFSKWAEYQPTRADLEAGRAKEADRKRRWRERQHPSTVPPGQYEGRGPESDYPDPTRPDPTRPIEEAKASSPRRETALPKSWAPTVEHIKRAKELGLDVVNEAENFRLHAETHDRRAANWNGAFTMWLKKSKPTRPNTDWALRL